MADTFTDMHQQLNGKIEELAITQEKAVRRAVRKFAKRKENSLEVEVELLGTLGLDVAP